MSRYDRQQQPGGSVIEVLIAMDGGGVASQNKGHKQLLCCHEPAFPFGGVAVVSDMWFLTAVLLHWSRLEALGASLPATAVAAT